MKENKNGKEKSPCRFAYYYFLTVSLAATE
jgi:hypothetical protein